MPTTPSPASDARPILAPEQLREMRAMLGMTQAQLGAELDVNEHTVTRWEAGLTPIGSPRRLRLALIALLLGYRADGSRGPGLAPPQGL